MAINLREIVSISGKSGLYRVVRPGRQGILVESLDDRQQRLMVNASQQVSSLGDISIYTTSDEGTVALPDVLTSIRKEFGPKLELTAKAEPQELVAFIRRAVPDYDTDRVYLSDVKKLVTWYNILGPHLDEASAEASDEEAADSTDELSTGGAVPEQQPDSSDDTPIVQ